MFDLQGNVNSNSYAFQGAIFDGRYVYFVPNNNGGSTVLTRYDTTNSFFTGESYSAFDIAANVNSNSLNFTGAIFDGRYVYLVPNSIFYGQITRYDTAGSFTASTSYATFDTAANVNSNSRGFFGAAFDGRYIYFAPFNNNSNFGQITRFDTSGNFTSSTSYAVFDTASSLNSNSNGFQGAVFDGHYVYFVPHANGQITRYDTTGTFQIFTSYAVFNTQSNVNSNSSGFAGGVFDGRYLYLVPNNNGTSGQITRLDTTLDFTASTSYSVLNTAVSSINSNSRGFIGGMFDGRYVYLVPYNNGSNFGQVTRIDAYVGDPASIQSAAWAANGISIGSYAGIVSSPNNGMIVSGNVGIGTPNPAFPLDVNGTISTPKISAPGSQIQFQSLTLAQGYSQGSFGGGSVGTNKIMSDNVRLTISLTTTVNSRALGFQGGVFDGKYVYLIPNFFGLFTRYNTQAGSFTMSTSYEVFNLQANVNSNCYSFQGGIFDGRYVYLSPTGTAGALGLLTRYNTNAPFGLSTSYSVFGLGANVNSNARAFSGAVFDGRYVYFVPGGTTLGVAIRYDTTQSFTTSTSYVAFNATANLSSNSTGFIGGAFDGRYVYFVPGHNTSDSGQITRYDTTGSFTQSTSYAIYNMAANVNSNSRSFGGAIFDGRYLYFVPYGTSSSQGQITRYDTTGSFTTSASYAVYNTAANVSSTSSQFWGGVYDGRYVYYVPVNQVIGTITRYDTTLPFTASTSYTLDPYPAGTQQSRGFIGSVFDGRYIYFIPFTNSTATGLDYFTRVDSYPGPQATPTAASWAVNGFVIGSYVGTNIASASFPTNDLIVSGLIGLNTPSPTYNLDVNTTVQANAVYSTETTQVNQSISLAQGINQGSFGGGSVGTIKTMSTNTTLQFDVGANLSSNSVGFQGAVFDGRYVYFIPNTFGQFTRYDTTTNSFSTSTSYAFFDTAANVNSNSSGFLGGVFDGRFVYFVPNSNGQITRYDTTTYFTQSTSYSVFNTTANVNSNSMGFAGGIFDGRYVYFVPNITRGHFGQITRYDTTLPFTSSTSYAYFSLTAHVNSQAQGFFGGTYDGRYVYFAPNANAASSLVGLWVKFDTSGSFTTSTNYTVFDTAANVNSNSLGFNSAIFDGRYVYLVPYGSTTLGQITRYDTTGGFTTSTSYAVYNTAANVNSMSFGFTGGVFDGRYIYLAPTSNGVVNSGQVTRYDTTLSFTQSTSYSILSLSGINASAVGYQGAVFDGKSVYFVPSNGLISRIDGYVGQQASAIAISQAPNGFVIGPLAGSATPVSNGLLISSSVTWNRNVVSASYTAQSTDTIIGCTTSGITITLPTTIPPSGFIYIIEDESGTASAGSPITISRSGAQTINGATSTTIITAYGTVRLYSNGTNWFIW